MNERSDVLNDIDAELSHLGAGLDLLDMWRFSLSGAAAS